MRLQMPGLAPLLLLTATSCAARAATSAPEARIVRVIDGDTVVVERYGQIERCRLLGIDAPELSYGGLLADLLVWGSGDSIPSIQLNTAAMLLSAERLHFTPRGDTAGSLAEPRPGSRATASRDAATAGAVSFTSPPYPNWLQIPVSFGVDRSSSISTRSGSLLQ